MATIESLQAQVVALQASEAKLMEENDKLRDEASGEGGDDLVYENDKLKEEVMKLTGWLATAHENADAKIHNESAGLIIQENDKLKEEIDDLKYDMDNDLYTEEDLTELKEGWGEVLQGEIDELKAEKAISLWGEKLRVTDTYICGNGVCKGETYEKAKRIIIEKEGYEYWELWRKRVNWVFV